MINYELLVINSDVGGQAYRPTDSDVELVEQRLGAVSRCRAVAQKCLLERLNMSVATDICRADCSGESRPVL